MYARLALHTADPARLGEVISHYEEDVWGVFSHEPGNRGMSMLVNDDLGVLVVESYWATEKEMRANDATFVRPVHDAAYFGATVSTEHFEVARFVHATPARPGGAVNLTRLDAQPESLDGVLAAYGESAAETLTRSDGFCTFALLVDRDRGRVVVDATWRDAQVLAAARGVAAERRLAAITGGEATVRGIEQYRLDFQSVELE